MVMGVKVIGHEVYRGLLMGFMGFLSAEDACYPNHFPHCFYLSNKFHTSSAILFFLFLLSLQSFFSYSFCRVSKETRLCRFGMLKVRTRGGI